MQTLLLQYDVISLSETKTQMSISLPGFATFRCISSVSPNRGGVAVLVKNYLVRYVSDTDFSAIDQVWMKFRCFPNIMFGFCYIPPQDSEYFTHQSFAAIQEKISDGDCQYVIMGDLNCRFGNYLRDLPVRSEIPHAHTYEYPFLPDCVNTPNDNAYVLSTICIDKRLVVVNNLKTPTKHYKSDLTYRKGRTWVSELDVCVVSHEAVSNISSFSVHKTECLPSDHAPISIDLKIPDISLDAIYSRACQLGGHASLVSHEESHLKVRRPVKFSSIDPDAFFTAMNDLDVSDYERFNDVDVFAQNMSDALYESAKSSRLVNGRRGGDGTSTATATVPGSIFRWDKLLQDRDDRRVWQAINWKGCLDDDVNNDIRPTDEEFKQFYEDLLGTATSNLDDECRGATVSIPVLDDVITPEEVVAQVGHIKTDKACGPDGISPGVFRLLPAQWLILITTLFNSIFTSAQYPTSWIRAKFFTIFKKGDRKDAKNYRGISIINSIAKLFDMVLCSRLEQWFTPYREQAGAQKGRGCLEHIVTLRILTDLAKKKKKKLFVTFIDFSQAYDLVPRHILIRILKRLGCGAVMLAVIAAMYSVTESVIGTAVFTVTMGVRQGSPTSCLLFVLYVNDLIK